MTFCQSDSRAASKGYRFVDYKITSGIIGAPLQCASVLFLSFIILFLCSRLFRVSADDERHFRFVKCARVLL